MEEKASLFDLAVFFCGFFSHLIGHETINIPEIFSGFHGFTGKTVILRTTDPLKCIFDQKTYRLTYPH